MGPEDLVKQTSDASLPASLSPLGGRPRFWHEARHDASPLSRPTEMRDETLLAVAGLLNKYKKRRITLNKPM